jgi:hypothetical protein
VAKARNSVGKARNSLEKAEKEAQRLARKVKELENDKAKLAEKCAQQAKDSSFVGQDQKILVKQVKPGYRAKMCDAVKATVWGLFKFLSTNPEDQAKVYTLARRGMDPKVEGTPEEKKKWEYQHSTLIAYALNKTRTYCQSELRKKMGANFTAKGLPLPPTEQIAKCVYRTIDKDDPEEMELFRVYVEQLLPPVIGRRKEFGVNTSHYQTISEATGSTKGVKLVTPQDEAMLLAIYDSVADSCEVFYNAKKDFEAANKGRRPNKTIVYNSEPEPGKPEVSLDDNGNLCLYGTKFKPKYSNCKAGSDQNNGWVQEGVDFYHDAWRKAAAARATPQCKALERAFLEMVQKGRKKPTPKSKDTNAKKRKEAPPLYADIEVGSSDDEGENRKVAAAVDEEDAYHEEDYVDDDDEEAEFEG